MDVAIDNAVEVAGLAIGDLPRFMSLARVECPIDVQHLELHRLADGELAGQNLRRLARMVVCLVRYDGRAQHKAFFQRFDLKTPDSSPWRDAREFATTA
jgi:hypothetical protein